MLISSLNCWYLTINTESGQHLHWRKNFANTKFLTIQPIESFIKIINTIIYIFQVMLFFGYSNEYWEGMEEDQPNDKDCDMMFRFYFKFRDEYKAKLIKAKSNFSDIILALLQQPF